MKDRLSNVLCTNLLVLIYWLVQKYQLLLMEAIL